MYRDGRDLGLRNLGASRVLGCGAQDGLGLYGFGVLSIGFGASGLSLLGFRDLGI